MEDSEDVLDGWSRRRGPGYFAVLWIALLVSLLVVAGAQLALARWGTLHRLLGGAGDDPGRAKVEVPAVTRIPLEAASELLVGHGLKLLSVGSAADPEVPPGWIVTQSPAAGAKLRRGRTVRVTLSGGPPLVPVPGVVGASLPDAQRLLEQAGLHVGAIEATGATLRVTGARPAAGEQATTGSAITLVVEVAPTVPAEAPEEPAAHGRRGR